MFVLASRSDGYFQSSFNELLNGGRPFTGAWIETDTSEFTIIFNKLSPLHGGVDRNNRTIDAAKAAAESPLHGGVDRNER